MAQTVGKLPVISHPHLQDIFADDAIAFDNHGGVIRISMATIKMSDPAPPSALAYVTVGRVVMPVAGAQRLAIALFDYLKKQGLDPAEIVGGGDDTPVN